MTHDQKHILLLARCNDNSFVELGMERHGITVYNRLNECGHLFFLCYVYKYTNYN